MWASAAITLARELYPWLTTDAASDAFLTSWYGHAEEIAGDAYFGDAVIQARAHLLAHAACIVDPTGALSGYASGPVQSIRSGARARAYATVQTTSYVSLQDAELARTPAGRAYLMLRDSRAARIGAVY